MGHEVVVAAHFPYTNGIVADGVARWCWDVLCALRRAGIDAYGVGYVGGTTNDRKIVSTEHLVETILGQNPKVCVILTSCKAEEMLRACEGNRIKSVWIQPYWGVTEKVRSLVEHATVTVTPLPAYTNALRNATHRRVETVPFPIDTRFWCPGQVESGRLPMGWDNGELNLVYAGRLGGGENMHGLIPPYKEHLVGRLPRHRMWFVGPEEGKVAGLLRDNISRCGVGGTVTQINRYAGSDTDVLNLYRAADVFVFPSSWESYAYTPLEVMSCAAPLVTFGSPQIPSMSYFPEYPYSAEPGDWKGFCDNVLKIVEDPVRARETMIEYRKVLSSVMGADVVMPKILRLIKGEMS